LRGARYNPNYATIVKLARALSVTPGAIVTRADELLKTRS
jgi:hypothetical protein